MCQLRLFAECRALVPVFLDGWTSANHFICMLGEAALNMDHTWRTVWEQKVGVIVALLTPSAKDDLSTLGLGSDFKFFGEVGISLQTEDILPDYTIRTVKIAHRKSKLPARYVTQLVFARWPENGLLPDGEDLLNFVKAAFSCREGRVLVQSRAGLDSCLIYSSLESNLAQAHERGDINLTSYARHVAVRSGLALSSVEQHIFLHDVLAEAVEYGQMHAVIVTANGLADSNGSLANM